MLNQHLGRPFTDWLNEHRLNDVKTQLLDPTNDRFTIEGLARSSGFKSRAGFYRVFKRATGATPVEFRRLRRAGDD